MMLVNRDLDRKMQATVLPPAGSSLASFVFQLCCLQGDSKTRSLGHAAKAQFLRAVTTQNEGYASRIESSAESESYKAYTVSPLYNTDFKVPKPASYYKTNARYFMRITAYNQETICILNHAAVKGLLAPGHILDLDQIPFLVEAVTSHPQAHPLAMNSDYGSLALPWWSGNPVADRRVSLQFLSPTMFKKAGDLYVSMPLPELLFGSLLDRWNAHAPVKLPVEWKQAFRDEVVFSRFDLHSEVTKFKAGSLKIGAVGTVTYEAPRAVPHLLQVLNLLADFSIYSGAGLMTTMGLGQVRRCATTT